MKRGKYELKKRAERQQETRLRIARATLELHEILGPALTTRSAIAQRAGVTRPTVYSHFPDDLTLGKACSSLEMSDNPLPDPERSEEHTSELQSRQYLVCRLLLEKKQLLQATTF